MIVTHLSNIGIILHKKYVITGVYYTNSRKTVESRKASAHILNV